MKANLLLLLGSGDFDVREHRESRRRLVVILAITGVSMIVELAVAYWSNSLSMVGDGIHMFGDFLANLIAFISAILQQNRQDKLGNSNGAIELWAAVINAFFLLLLAFIVIATGLYRLAFQPPIETQNLLIVGFLGLLANIICLRLAKVRSPPIFRDSKSHDAHNSNLEIARMHVFVDLLGSVSVLVSTLLVKLYSLARADSFCAIGFAYLVLRMVFPLFKRDALSLFRLRSRYQQQSNALSPIQKWFEKKKY